MNTRVSKRSIKKLLLPPIVGLLVMIGIIGLFNAEYISARVSYALTERASTESSQTTPTLPQAESTNPRIILPNIGVNAPTIYDPNATNEDAIQLALRNGVLHFPGTALPGETGNVVIIGHSSGRLLTPGNYKFVFTNLDKLHSGDNLFLDYQGIRYTYRVTGQQIILPTDVGVLSPTNDYRLTLITCYPIGSNAKRLVITAEQIDPKPVVKPEEFLPGKNNTSTPTIDQSNTWNSLSNVF